MKNIKDMRDEEFLRYLYRRTAQEKGIVRDINYLEVGDNVVTVGVNGNILTSEKNNGTMSVVDTMIEDCNENKILSIKQIDKYDDSILLSNGYWYFTNYIELI